MIGKIRKGRSFSGCIRYVTQKDDAKIIASEGVLLGTAEEMAEYAKNRGIGAVHLLPFNPLARSKYEQLGRKYPFTEGFMKESELNGILNIWRRFCPETVLKN